MANTILVATDFSPSAQNAATYALHLAAQLKCNLHVLHSYIVPFAYTDSPVPLLNIDEMQKISEDSIAAEVDRLSVLHAGVAISHAIVPGDLLECLMEAIDDSKPKLIVLGTSGQGGKGFFWGSMAISALRNLQAPVLVIPHNITWEPVDHLCLAADYKQNANASPLKQLADWAQELKSNLAVVYVNKNRRQDVAPPELLVQELTPAAPTYYQLADESLETAVTGFVAEHKVDWLVLLPKKYGFFEGLFHSSRTKLLGQICKIPILALH